MKSVWAAGRWPLLIILPSSPFPINPPFDKAAELYGAKGYKVDKVSEISEAVKSAIKCNKPAVIDVAVDPKALYSFRRDSFKHRIK